MVVQRCLHAVTRQRLQRVWSGPTWPSHLAFSPGLLLRSRARNITSRMAGALTDSTRAPVAFGRRAVPLLFEQLHEPETGTRLRALASLCGLMHDPDRLYQTITGGFLEQLKVLLTDEDPSVRVKTCELLHLLTGHSVGRQALLSSSLLPPLSQLLDDSSSSCRRNVHRVLNRLALLPAGADALLTLVPKLMLKLREEEEEEEEVQVLLLSTLSCCSRLDALPALASDGVSLLGRRLSHRSPNIRREAAAAMMALSVPEDGKRQVCEEAVLPVLVGLLQDEDVEVQANAAGVIMYTVIITTGKQLCLDLDVVPVLLDLVSKKTEEEDMERRRRRKALTMYSLRALTALAEAPDGRRLLLEQLPLLVRRSEAVEEDWDIRRAAQTAVRVVTWTP
ncbi:radial spoke head 14 homolog [Trachinotus anak]|uniref:radial spoke head 14 homolog n=1 Tax=Trachinotus anak TaxID=443729 RepID=UPI0039F1E014